MKKCSKCGVIKPLSQFSPNGDRMRADCKTCNSNKGKIYHQEHRDEIREKRKTYYKDNKDKLSIKDKKYRAKNILKITEYQEKYREAHKEKNRLYSREYYNKNRERLIKENSERYQQFPVEGRARWMVAEAIKQGKMKCQPCGVCRSIEKIEAHHPDYTKPLDVRWLCKEHHGKIHRRSKLKMKGG